MFEKPKFEEIDVKELVHDGSLFSATNHATSHIRNATEDTQREPHFKIQVLLSVMIEVSSFVDFASDFWILQALAKSVDTMWFTFALFTVLCPYYTVYTSLMTFQIDKLRK